MPNTSKGGGISRKIVNSEDRKKIRNILHEIKIPDGEASSGLTITRNNNLTEISGFDNLEIIEGALHISNNDNLNEFPEFPELMDKANYALQLMAEGKLNIGMRDNKRLEVEQLRLKNFRNNVVISLFGIVIV